MENLENQLHFKKPNKTIEIIPSQKFLMGVCAALGNYAGINPVFMRVIFLISFILFGQSILLIYAALGILLPHKENLNEIYDNNANKLTSNLLLVLFVIIMFLLQIKYLSLKEIFVFLNEHIDAFSLLVLSIALIINGYHKVSLGMSQSNYKLLRRSEKKIISGVCGGFAEYLDINPNLMRIIWIIFGISSLGLAIIIYIVLTLIIPTKEEM